MRFWHQPCNLSKILLRAGGDVVARCTCKTVSSQPLCEISTVEHSPLPHDFPERRPSCPHGVNWADHPVVDFKSFIHSCRRCHQLFENWKGVLLTCSSPQQWHVHWRPPRFTWNRRRGAPIPETSNCALVSSFGRLLNGDCTPPQAMSSLTSPLWAVCRAWHCVHTL